MSHRPFRDCNVCPMWRGMANRKRGWRIPLPEGKGWGGGKCTWPPGPEVCRPAKVRGKIGEGR